MYFKNQQTAFALLVGGYTDEPEYYGGALGRNALSCQFAYAYKGEKEGLLWDELFQTEDLLRLYEGIAQLLQNQIDRYEYADRWKYVQIKAVRRPGDTYELWMSVYMRGGGQFHPVCGTDEGLRGGTAGADREIPHRSMK